MAADIAMHPEEIRSKRWTKLFENLKHYYLNSNKKINFNTKKTKKIMKKILLAATALLMMAGILTSCGGGQLKGFKKTKTGLHYKFHVKADSPRAEIGDIIVAEIWVHFGNDVSSISDDNLEYTNAGTPDPLFQVMESQYDGDIMEALRMIGAGDSVTFAFNLETMRKHNQGMMMEDDNKFLFWTIKVDGVYSEEEFEIKMEEDQIRGEAEEQERIAAYISEEGITVKPNADGVYVIVHRRGTGAVATRGKNIEMNYTGRLLDGTIFDTSLESVAREHDLFMPGRDYVPLPFMVGVGQVIPGMDNAILDMRVGTKATLIIPSNVAYGARSQGNIPGFSTLIFDIEIVSVK
jgi:FKBP-type peptidyl-prolyl cis-trans isomerase